ncbi:hypothetical protein VUR80DRAFT_7105 [Thermomyces stellatus]
MAGPEEGSKAWAAQDKGPSILIVCWLVTALSTLFVFARVYVRGWMQRNLQQDDWWIIIAMVCGYVSTSLSTLAVASGNGKHWALLTVEQQQGAILWTTAAFCPGVMSFGLPKMAVAYLLTKLLNPSKWHKYFLWWLGIWCQLTLFATVGVLIGRCTPARSQWDFSVKGECFDSSILVAYCIYAGAFSAFVDFYFAVYPTVVLFNLQLSLKKKFALSVALGIGSISGIVAVYKTTRIPSLGSPDFSYDTSDLVVWTVIEGSTIIIASSIPILQPLLEKILRHNPFASSGKSSKPNGRYYEDYTDARSGYELGDRKTRTKLKGDLGLTIIADGGSEDGILNPTDGQHQQSAFAVADDQFIYDGHEGSGRAGSRDFDGKILKTNTVTVTYDEEAQPGNITPPRSSPIAP